MSIQDKIEKLEKEFRGLSGIEPGKKAELHGLIESIKSEASHIAKAGARASDLARTIRTFEGIHPKLVGVIDDISRLLSEIGI